LYSSYSNSVMMGTENYRFFTIYHYKNQINYGDKSW